MTGLSSTLVLQSRMREALVETDHIYSAARLTTINANDRTAIPFTTGNEGQFFIDNLPPGRIDLFVDGKTVNPANFPNPSSWVSLHYAVRGQQNKWPHAIYVFALLTNQVKIVDRAKDVILTTLGPQVNIKGNCVAITDGSRVGSLDGSPMSAGSVVNRAEQ